MLPVIVIVGPTASGKSSLALEVAEKLGGEIVNADAFQVYRGLEILTAQPSTAELRRVRHHLYGCVSLSEEITAAAYARQVEKLISDLRAGGKVPILCGGTGLYVKALTHGLDPVPPSDPVLRSELEKRSLEDLAAELRSLDPNAIDFVDLQNPRRVVRALEITLLTGIPASQLRSSWKAKPREGFLGFSIVPERETLRRRIAQRTHAMMTGGVVEEVRQAQAAGPAARRAIGFREVEGVISGTTATAECEERINLLTGQYAKRQGTWFRKENWLSPLHPGGNDAHVAIIRDKLEAYFFSTSSGTSGKVFPKTRNA